MKEIELKYGAKLLVPENVDARMVIAGTCCGGKTESFTFDLTKRKISIGQKYSTGYGEYLLAQTSPNKVAFINIESGQLFDYGEEVMNCFNISLEEFELITGNEFKFKLVEDYDEC